MSIKNAERIVAQRGTDSGGKQFPRGAENA
jgi:hypothetical protein